MMFARLFLFAAFLGSTGCATAMIMTIENRGAATVEIHALCGDSQYRASFGSADILSWNPIANSCHIDVRGDSAGRRLRIRNQCRHAYGCYIGVVLPTQGKAELRGTGQVDVVGDLLTSAPGGA